MRPRNASMVWLASPTPARSPRRPAPLPCAPALGGFGPPGIRSSRAAHGNRTASAQKRHRLCKLDLTVLI
eukprot:COSAG06_NODE_21009_length_773_cov_1.133531_2_plen_70_part_00